MDAVWSINQTTKEKAAGVGRIFVVKHRNGKSRYHFYYSQNKDTLIIQPITEAVYRDLVSAVKELKDEDKVVGGIEIPDANQPWEANGGEPQDA
jgi:sortase (surface protein transpeptidase)